jgi:hypothetical protein
MTASLGSARAVLALAGLLGVGAAPQPIADAMPEEPIAAIVNAFQTHQLVALGDPHGNEQVQKFLISLIRDPRFSATVNDIVVEFGNPRYQDVADRYVRGDDVPDAVLRQVWQNAVTPTSHIGRPHNDEVLDAVRAVNAPLPAQRHLRVLLGDPPIDWDAIHTRKDHWKWVEMRDAYPAALIQTAVLARERKALIYGSGHLQRKQLLSNFEMDTWQAQTLVSLLERSGPGRVFVILPHSRLADMQPNAALWPAPSLAVIRGTVLGAVDVARYWADSPSTRFTLRDGDHLPIPRQQWRSLRAEDQFDAVLYLGQPSAMTTIEWSPALCADAEYIENRLERIALAGLPPIEADRLREYCAGVKH